MARIAVRVLAVALAAAAVGCGADGDVERSAADAAWRPIGPDGAQVTTLAVEPGTGTVLAGTAYGGVFRRGAGDETWKQSGLTDTNVFAFAFASGHPRVVYAAGAPVVATETLRGGVFRSTDGGRRWHPCDEGLISNRPYWDPGRLPYRPTVWSIVVHPDDPKTLYAAGETSIFRSRDGARRWVRVGVPNDDATVTALAIDPRPPHAVYAVQSNGVAKSIDEGRSWQVSSAGLLGYGNDAVSASAIAVDPNDSRVLFLAGAGGVYQSVDGGESWRLRAGGVDDAATLGLGATRPSTIYAGGYVWDDVDCIGGCFPFVWSRDGGSTWTRAVAPADAGAVRALAIDPDRPRTAYAYAGHLFHSDDGGAHWTRAERGLANTTMGALLADPEQPTTLYTVTAGVVKSVDAGHTWIEQAKGMPRRNLGVLTLDPRQPATLYAGTRRVDQSSDDTGLYVSSDGGASWRHLALAGRHLESITVDPASSTTLYVGTAAFQNDFDYTIRDGGDVLRSTDGGVTWATLFHFDDPEDYAARIVTDPRLPDTLYVLPARTGVLATTDGGRHWDRRSFGMPKTARVFALLVDRESATTLHAATTAGVYTSVDGGVRWKPSLPLPHANQRVADLVADPADPRVLYATVALDLTPGPSAGTGVFRSSDDGETWERYGTDLPPRGAYGLTIAGAGFSELYAGTFGTGIWVHELDPR